MTQQTRSAALALEATARPVPLAAARLEQFLDLQSGLLVSGSDYESVADRLAQGAAIFLRLPGAAVGAIEDGRYRLLAAYGLDGAYRARYEGAPPWDATGSLLVSGRPLVIVEPDDPVRLQTIVLPFLGPDLAGALHLALSADSTLTDEELHLARALAVTAGAVLANARQCRRLAQVARLKGDALASMAHDLRTPLNALVGYASLLGDGAFGPVTDEQRQVCATLERQAVELIDLLGATLDVARLETGQLPVRCEEFALADVLGGLRAATFARASGDGLLSARLPPDLPRLRTDRVKVKEIVQNLVDNALRHSAGGPVEIEAAVEPGGDSIRLTVSDRGPGIDADVLPHVFEPFRRGAGDAAGTGFGLYIVRCFAEALGGQVTARSEPGHGTAITVELPLAAPARG